MLQRNFFWLVVVALAATNARKWAKTKRIQIQLFSRQTRIVARKKKLNKKILSLKSQHLDLVEWVFIVPIRLFVVVIRNRFCRHFHKQDVHRDSTQRKTRGHEFDCARATVQPNLIILKVIMLFADIFFVLFCCELFRWLLFYDYIKEKQLIVDFQ